MKRGLLKGEPSSDTWPETSQLEPRFSIAPVRALSWLEGCLSATLPHCHIAAVLLLCTPSGGRRRTARAAKSSCADRPDPLSCRCIPLPCHVTNATTMHASAKTYGAMPHTNASTTSSPLASPALPAPCLLYDYSARKLLGRWLFRCLPPHRNILDQNGSAKNRHGAGSAGDARGDDVVEALVWGIAP
jgi:hypothetical protein